MLWLLGQVWCAHVQQEVSLCVCLCVVTAIALWVGFKSKQGLVHVYEQNHVFLDCKFFFKVFLHTTYNV